MYKDHFRDYKAADNYLTGCGFKATGPKVMRHFKGVDMLVSINYRKDKVSARLYTVNDRINVQQRDKFVVFASFQPPMVSETYQRTKVTDND